MPLALQEPVMSMELSKRDVRLHWLKVDKRTALLVLDPVLLGWLRFNTYNKMWPYDYLPDDNKAIDISQRAVIVQVLPVRSLWDTLDESRLPSNWKPVVKVELHRDGEICEWIEVNRLPVSSPAAQEYYNHGFYGFEPECFSTGETVELIVWRSSNSETVSVPDALRFQLREHFRIFDSAINDSTNASSFETARQPMDSM